MRKRVVDGPQNQKCIKSSDAQKQDAAAYETPVNAAICRALKLDFHGRVVCT
jgi:hypothetical protein